MTAMRPLARRHRRDHALALALWSAGVHEARLLAALIDDPQAVTPAQMDAWAADFDSWDLCDQACSKLFVRTSFARTKIREWAADEREFVRRAGFVLIAAYAVHARDAPDDELRPWLGLVERHSRDSRNFVRKAVNWALRQIGKRSPALHAPALALADRLAASADRTARWIGRDAARELRDPYQLRRLGLEAPPTAGRTARAVGGAATPRVRQRPHNRHGAPAQENSEGGRIEGNQGNHDRTLP